VPLTLPTRRLVAVPGAALGLAAIAAGLTYLMYAVSPVAALGAVAGVAVAGMILARPIYGAYAGLLAVPLEVGLVRVPLVSSVTVAEVLFLLTGIAGALHMFATRGSRPAPVHVPFLGLIIVATSGFVVAHDTSAVTRITRVWLAYFFLSIVVSRASRKEVERVLLCLATAGALAGVAAIFNTGQQVVAEQGSLVAGRASAGFAHPNVLAFFLVMSFPQAIALAGRGRLVQRFGMTAAAGTIIFGLLLTLTRSALIGGAAALLVLIALPGFRRLIGIAIVCVAAFAVVNFQAIQGNSEVTVLSQRLSTVNASGLQRDPRIPIWNASPGIIAAHPIFGVGEGNFSIQAEKLDLLDPADDLPYDHAHDIFLTIAAELGLVGLAVFLAWIYMIGGVIRANLRRRDWQWPIKLSLTSAMVGMLITSFTEYPPRTNVIMATFLILVGLLAALQRLGQEEDAAAALAAAARDAADCA